MATEKKMTKVEAFTLARGIIATSGHIQTTDILAKIDAELAQLAKKNASKGAKSAERVAADNALTSAVQAYMTENPHLLVSTSDLIKSIPALSELSTQKVRPLLTPLLDAGVIHSTKVKGKVLFQYGPDPTTIQVVA